MIRAKNRMPIRTIARFLASVMILPHLMLITASTIANAQVEGAQYVAVIDFTNMSNYGDSMISRLATDAVVVEMNNVPGKFSVATRQSVETARVDLDLQYPLTLTGVLRIAERLAVDAVLVGEVREVRITDNPRQARVEIAVRLLEASTGEPINGAIVRGASAPQATFTGDDDILVTQAINNAAYMAVRRMVEYIIPEATVLNAVGDDQVLLNRGAQDGIQRGMEMLVSRGPEVIGKLRVVDVTNNDSLASIISATRGVRPEDRARAIFRLPTRAPSAYGDPVSKISGGIIGTERRKTGAGQILPILLGIGALILLANSSSSSGETVGSNMHASAGAPPALATPTGLPGVRITLDPGRFGVTNQNILQFKIYRDDQATPVWATGRNIPTFTDYQLGLNQEPREFSYLQVSQGINPGDEPDSVDGTNPGVQVGQTYTYSASVVYSRRGLVPGEQDPVPIYEEGAVQIIGVATPLNPVLRTDLILPEFNSAAVNPSNVTFEWRSTLGADTYIVEVSTTPDFKNVRYRSPEVLASRFADGQPVLLQDVNISANLAGVPAEATLYWRVGARNSGDSPGPIPDPGTGLRYVYGEISQFRNVAVPPPPP